MRYALLTVLLLSGCLNNEWAADYKPGQGPRVVVSSRLISEPREVLLVEERSEGPPRIETRSIGTRHPQKSSAEMDAVTSQYIIGSGIAFILLGIGYMIARRWFPLFPTYGSTLMFKAGACCIAWGGAPPDYRGWIVAGIIVAGLAWMIVRSYIHNGKQVDQT